MRIFYTTTILCLVMLGLMSSCQQNSDSQKNTVHESQPSDKEKTDQLVVKQMESFDAPGLAVGLMKNGEIVYADAHGVQGLDTRDPLTTKSLFHMASVSKPFVATGIVQLMEQGKLQLNDKLTDHLPYFKMADPRYTDITLNHMLNHTSGIPDVEDYEWDNPQYDEGAAERYARSFETVMLDFAPGSAYNYSNAAFDILCDVIAKVSGMAFENYMKVHIFEPVGMGHSTFYKPEVPEEIATKPHVRGDSLHLVVSKIYPYNRRHAGSSTLHSNVEDMMLWAEVNLNKGVINGKRIYQESSYELLTTAQTKIGERSVGLSWFLNKLNGTKIVFHQGGDTGYSTFFAFIPE
ncbi:MAG: serine hydrolase domain-containing protein, partial [Bacteroidota bacterium]